MILSITKRMGIVSAVELSGFACNLISTVVCAETLSRSVCVAMHVSAECSTQCTVGDHFVILSERRCLSGIPCCQIRMERLYSYAMRSISDEKQPIEVWTARSEAFVLFEHKR